MSAAALPLHLPSKAEHLGQGGFPLTDVHFRSVSSPSRLRQSSIVFPGLRTGTLARDAGGPSRAMRYGAVLRSRRRVRDICRKPSRTSLLSFPTEPHQPGASSGTCVCSWCASATRGRDLCGLCKSHLAHTSIVVPRRSCRGHD